MNVSHGASGWSLDLQGSREYGTPMRARFERKGVINGDEWKYDYDCYLVPNWPDGINQVPALVGSLVRTIPHPGGQPGMVSPAGVVFSFFAIKQE